MPVRAATSSVRVGTLLAWVLVACSGHAHALNPALDISQYAHTAWKAREGFLQGRVTAIAQTPDGYLWVGTDHGLFRFDGVRSVVWQPAGAHLFASSRVTRLRSGRDGTLWIGTIKGLASWKDGRLTAFPELADKIVIGLSEDHEGSIWVGMLAYKDGGLCRIRQGAVTCDRADGKFGNGVWDVYEDRKGNLWVSVAYGMWRWKPGVPEFHAFPEAADSIRNFVDDAESGGFLVSTRAGIERVVDGRAGPYPLAGVSPKSSVGSMLRDRDGSLWIGTVQGLVHQHGGRIDRFTRAEGLSGEIVEALFEDREGNMWVATEGGLDRFREVAIPTLTVDQGLLSPMLSSVATGEDGSVWIATSRGLNRWIDGRLTVAQIGNDASGKLNDMTPHSLLMDRRGRLWVSTMAGAGYVDRNRFVPVSAIPGRFAIHAMAEDHGGRVWLAHQQSGLFRVDRTGAVERIPWDALGRKDFGYSLAADPVRDGLWLGFYESGLAYYEDGQVRASYAAAEGLGAGIITDLRLDGDGTLWAATEGGLSRLKAGRIVTLTTRNGLPCDPVHAIVEDNDDDVWLSLACGLFRVARTELDAWAAAATAGKDSTWMVHGRLFDAADGVLGADFGGFSPRAAKSDDGRLWFHADDGVNVVDPRRIPFNAEPPPVHIEQLIANHDSHEVARATQEPLQLPALIRDLEIDYTALSLAAPEKNQFRVMLEGWDADWRDVGTRRQAYYNNLPPRTYRFRVVASNNSGVWNETGDVLEFAIAPAYYQRTSFRAALAAAALALLWALYRYRVRQIAFVYDARLEARVNERTRIARDLHDTLLQSLHGLLFRFQAAANLLPGRPGEAKQTLESAIDQAAQAITEGRDAVQGLRSSSLVAADLGSAVGELAEELAAAASVDGASSRPVVDLTVTGAQRDLAPLVRDEIYRITAEALRNAYRHARARRIEIEISYGERELTVHVRDDGCGMDPSLLGGDRPGHFGLPGMRERAAIAGGRLELWSHVGSGTEVELTIPAATAYTAPRVRERRTWFTGNAGSRS